LGAERFGDLAIGRFGEIIWGFGFWIWDLFEIWNLWKNYHMLMPAAKLVW